MPEPSKDQLLSLYRTMLVIRRTEEQLVKFYAAGRLYGGVHTYIGEEAVATGVCSHLRDDDVAFSTHRGHGHAVGKGVPPREVIAELMGRATGCSGGRGGSMHLFKPEIGFMGSSGIVGPSITLAAGGGYTAKLHKTDRVSVAFFGDGATGNGAFHEGLNLSTAWDLPVLFVCENNLYATEVPIASATRNTDVASKARAYGLPGLAVDGNDVLAVIAASSEALARARAGGGPTLIEAVTYRMGHHTTSDDATKYRSKAEVEEWERRDPLRRFQTYLKGKGVWDERFEASVQEQAAVDVEKAVEEAERRPQATPEEVFVHTYKTMPPRLAAQLADLKDSLGEAGR